MVSAAGFEPATHALKERFAQACHCVFNDLDNAYTIKTRPFDASCPQVAPKTSELQESEGKGEQRAHGRPLSPRSRANASPFSAYTNTRVGRAPCR